MNIFRVPSHGSPILARQNKSFYLIVLFAAIVVGVFFLVRYFLHMLKQRKLSPEYIEAQKKRITNRNDIDKTAERLKLSKEETQLLWTICKNNKAPNIYYLVEDSDAVDELFKTEYIDMKEHGVAPEEITMLFKLRHKIDQEIVAGIPITSTTALAEDTKFICFMNSGQQVSCTLKRNTPDGLLLDIPQALYDSPERPAELSKTLFTFTYPSITRYEFTSRIVRFDMGISGRPGMFISHSNELKISAKRSSRRIDYMKKTSFYAVSISEDGDKKIFTRKEKAYPCITLNLSGGGCCIAAPLPIKENQFISIDMPLNGTTSPVTGRIVETRKLEQKQFALHIAFAEISPEFQNTIYAMTYGYSS